MHSHCFRNQLGLSYENTEALTTSWTNTNSTSLIGHPVNETGKALQDANNSPSVYCAENLLSKDAITIGKDITRINFRAEFIPSQVYTIKLDNGTYSFNEGNRDACEAPKEGSDNLATAKSFTGWDTTNNTWNTDKIYLVQTATGSKDCKVYNLAGVTRVTLYENGVCYFNGNPITPAGKITRNTWYHLNITSIALPGEPSEEIGGGENGGVNFTIYVLEWNQETYDLELGQGGGNTTQP